MKARFERFVLLISELEAVVYEYEKEGISPSSNKVENARLRPVLCRETNERRKKLCLINKSECTHFSTSRKK